ncbi:alpha-L-fucosidase [Puteibacter caeruleilacunae]|nr:alpha-L-fucosidase [Puteibacter caeruleilacunae]
MKQNVLLAVLLLLGTSLFAQEVKRDWDTGKAKEEASKLWEAIDARPVPDWFGKAKFGIFIHWGPYSVPAWSPSGTYTEWYQKWWYSHSIFGNNNPQSDAIPNFQKNKYGEESSYYDFGKMLKAELYDPTEWADLFKRSGAKYIILTSKHHDGYTLWPNKQAQNGRFFPWNAGETGAKRDLIAPYMKAMREAGLKAGLYYSLYEWYHPWYQMRSDDFVTKHYHPQFKDLVSKYSPDLIYADGEWDMEDSYWRSGELLTWLFNESECGKDVVINDRWFKGSRFNHGGYYTTEYDAHFDDFDKPFEEIRGMGLSFGYNRDEDIEDYNTAQTLILMLCDIVCQGGNLCLNVGPSADGKIPVIMQERLLQIGEWLDLNGEAIYETTVWKKPFQWSKGNREFDFKAGKAYADGDYILKQTVKPIDGKAVKQMFFTKKGNDLYVILPVWNKKAFKIKDVKLGSGAKINLLGVDQKVKMVQRGKDVVVTLPQYDPSWNINDIAYVLKITNCQ